MSATDEVADRKAKLRRLLREREGEPKRAAIREQLAALPVDRWRFLSLPETDEVGLTSMVGSARAAGRLSLASDLSGPQFDEAARRVLASHQDDGRVLVGLTDYGSSGLFEIDLAGLPNVLSPLLEADRDSIIVVHPDRDWGLVGQRFEEADGVTYELEHWESSGRSDET